MPIILCNLGLLNFSNRVVVTPWLNIRILRSSVIDDCVNSPVVFQKSFRKS